MARAETDDALAVVRELAADPEELRGWAKLVLRRRAGEEGWERLVASPVALKRGPAIKLVTTAGPKERTETVELGEWPQRLQELLSEPLEAVHLVSPAGDVHARRSRKGRWLVSRGKPSEQPAAELPAHDRARSYPLPPEDPEAARLFVATGLFSPQGHPLGAQADKYRQVQHYLELLRPLPVWDHDQVRVLDAGCGKAYMSLALYAYGALRGVEVELAGIDSNPEVVEAVRAIAAELGYERTRFEAATILEHAQEAADRSDRVDLLVSLHACDTATDEAIAAGVLLGAEAIVLAPCCQHELHAQISERVRDDGEAVAAWTPVLEHGVLRGRLADLVTDSLRASVLEIFGYKAEAIEFVAAEHTAKNLMIRAVKRPPGKAADDAAREALLRYDELAGLWQVEPAARRLLAERWPA